MEYFGCLNGRPLIPIDTNYNYHPPRAFSQGRGTTDPTCILEELYWLLLITGHVLADAGKGETPLVILAEFSFMILHSRLMCGCHFQFHFSSSLNLSMAQFPYYPTKIYLR